MVRRNELPGPRANDVGWLSARASPARLRGMLLILSAMSAVMLAATDPQPLRITVDQSPTAPPSSVSSIQAAIASAQTAPPDVRAIEITIRPGVYEVRTPLQIGGLPATLRITAPDGAVRLVGGVVIHAALAPIPPDDPVRNRLPSTSVVAARWLDLSAACAKAELAEPVRHGMGLPSGAGSELGTALDAGEVRHG